MKKSKKYSKEEITHISENFVYITQKCSLKGNFSISPNTHNKLYNYKSGRFGDWCPQEKILKKILDCFNQSFSPPIDIYDLTHKKIEDMVFTPKESDKKLKWYEGTYFCYYLSNSGKYCHYGILKIFHSDTEYKCEAMLGFFEQQFDELKHQSYILENTNQPIKSIYDNYFRNSEYIPFGYFSGKVTISSDSVTIYLVNDKNSFARIITLKRFDRVSKYQKYQGGIGSMMTTSSADKFVVFENIGFSIIDIGQYLDKMKQLLRIDIDTESGVITNRNDDKNKRWFNMIEEHKSKNIKKTENDINLQEESD